MASAVHDFRQLASSGLYIVWNALNQIIRYYFDRYLGYLPIVKVDLQPLLSSFEPYTRTMAFGCDIPSRVLLRCSKVWSLHKTNPEDARELWYDMLFDPSPIHIDSSRTIGPIVRINPGEVHCSDRHFIDEIYAAGSRKRDKPVHQVRGSGL